MALLTTSALISDIKGRIGGNVFQRSSSGLTMRRAGGVVNRNSTGQNLVRNATAQIQSAWQLLTASDRTAWELYATFKNLPTRKSSLAKLNGQSLFMRINHIRLNYNFWGGSLSPEILTTPILTAPPLMPFCTGVVLDTGNLIVSQSPSVTAGDGFLIYWISRPLLSSQMSGHIKKRVMSQVITTGIHQTFVGQYQAIFGILPAVGDWLNVDMAYYNFATEQITPTSSARVQVTS